MVDEYKSIIKNSVWEVVPRLETNKLWVRDGSSRYKPKLVAKVYSQLEGIDYEEMFAPVEMYSSIRSILAMAALMGWEIHQMDVKVTFLNGVIEEEACIKKIEGFDTFDWESHVWKLKQVLYYLKQKPRDWYTRFDSYLTSLDFTKSEADENLNHILVEGKLLIIFLYVDDLILNGDEQLIRSSREDLAR